MIIEKPFEELLREMLQKHLEERVREIAAREVSAAQARIEKAVAEVLPAIACTLLSRYELHRGGTDNRLVIEVVEVKKP